MEVVQPEKARVKPLFRGTQIVWYILGFIEAILIIRFFLKLLGANPEAGFTNFMYILTWPFAQPFLYVINVTEIEGRVFEWTTLIAMMIYALVAWGIVKLLVMSKPVSHAEAEQKLNQQEKL